MSTVRKVPLRKCIGCNEMKNKKEMIRVVKTTEGTIVPDTTGRMNAVLMSALWNVWGKQ